MIVNVTTRAEKADRAARGFAERIKFSLRRFDSHITSIDAIFTDENGPKGGVDKRVSASIRLTNGTVQHYSFVGNKWKSAGKEVIRKAKYGMQNEVNRLARTSKGNRNSLRGMELLQPA